MKIKKVIQLSLLAGSALVLQACGGGSSESNSFFMVTNTKQGHVCVDGSSVKANTAEAQEMGNVLYYYYGSKGADLVGYSANVTCSNAKSTGARDPDVVISNAFYTGTIIPAYNARK